MRKVVQNGNVAIVIPNEFNTKWYTFHKVKELVFDPEVVKLVQELLTSNAPLKESSKIEEYCDETYGERIFYGDSMYLKVHWIPEGTKFSLESKDGWESLTDGEDFIA